MGGETGLAAGRNSSVRTRLPSRDRLSATKERCEGLFAAAMAHQERGEHGAAQRLLRTILDADPQHLESLLLLGEIAQRDGRNQVCIKRLTQVLALAPCNAAAHDGLAVAHHALGHRTEAIEHFTQAIAFGLGGVEGLIKLDPAVGGALALLARAWPRQVSLEDLSGGSASGFGALAEHTLLIALLRSRPVADLEIERLLRTVRRALLQQAMAEPPKPLSPNDLELACALAQQCFINEYIYDVDDVERAQAPLLADRLGQALETGRDVDPLAIAAVAAYRPLHDLPRAETLLSRSWPRAVTDLLIQQVREPMQERADRATIPALTAIADDTSLKVRAQYEDNPYPRWTCLVPPEIESVEAYLRRRLHLPSWDGIGRADDILVAGCGTGMHSIETAQRFPQARVLAVDLSLASLAYARRKTREANISNIDYAQADILTLGQLGRRFDVIEACGVLHHMADPEAGWRILLSLLRPGGLMLVGLYSAVARRPINAGRDHLAGCRGESSLEHVRRCRRELIKHRLHIATLDFCTSSGFRDLYLHVAERQFNIPEIASFVRQAGVRFLGFEVPDETRGQFLQRYPAAADGQRLECWHGFEQGHPHTFVGMYQFWLQKPV